jgi:hypothetical protein
LGGKSFSKGEKEEASIKQKNGGQKNKASGAFGRDFSARHFSAFSGHQFPSCGQIFFLKAIASCSLGDACNERTAFLVIHCTPLYCDAGIVATRTAAP